jgi:23S rRNA (uracil1939-C5)-methyltransferase
LGQAPADQAARKIKNLLERFQNSGVDLKSLHSQPQITTVSDGRTRDRTDLTLEDRDGTLHLGLNEIETRRTLDMPACPQLSTALEAWLQEFRKSLPPAVKKGSLRLRVSPKGERGIWLDFANSDVKNLFDQKIWLEELLQKAFVEVGQRRKHLVKDGDRLRLKDPEPQAWFETYVGGKAIPLWCAVGSFTQPGFAVNQALVRAVTEAVDASNLGNWLELFSGIGNFTLPLLANSDHRVTAYEIDELAVVSLHQTVKSLEAQSPETTVHERLTLTQGDAYRHLPELLDFEGLLVDPPRSGLKQTLAHLAKTSQATRPKILIYVSCFEESLSADAAQLQELGYKLEAIQGIDQFPQSPHCEWVAKFTRK